MRMLVIRMLGVLAVILPSRMCATPDQPLTEKAFRESTLARERALKNSQVEYLTYTWDPAHAKVRMVEDTTVDVLRPRERWFRRLVMFDKANPPLVFSMDTDPPIHGLLDRIRAGMLPNIDVYDGGRQLSLVGTGTPTKKEWSGSLNRDLQYSMRSGALNCSLLFMEEWRSHQFKDWVMHCPVPRSAGAGWQCLFTLTTPQGAMFISRVETTEGPDFLPVKHRYSKVTEPAHDAVLRRAIANPNELGPAEELRFEYSVGRTSRVGGVLVPTVVTFNCCYPFSGWSKSWLSYTDRGDDLGNTERFNVKALPPECSGASVSYLDELTRELVYLGTPPPGHPQPKAAERGPSQATTPSAPVGTANSSDTGLLAVLASLLGLLAVVAVVAGRRRLALHRKVDP